MKNIDCKIDCCDAFEWLHKMNDNSVDLILTDPPYESLEKYRAIGTTTRLKISKGSNNEWFPTVPNDRFEELLAHFFRVLKHSTSTAVINEELFLNSKMFILL
jgi:site-specific DNA-methyltransferase (adenine-specific)